MVLAFTKLSPTNIFQFTLYINVMMKTTTVKSFAIEICEQYCSCTTQLLQYMYSYMVQQGKQQHYQFNATVDEQINA